MIKKYGILSVCLCFLSSVCWPDTLKLKNGSTIIGSYAGGSESQIGFRVGSSVQHYNVSDVESLTFDAPGASRFSEDSGSPAPANPAPQAPQSYSNSVTVPAGTRLMVRTIDAIDSSKNQVGDKFLATLEQALYVNNVLVAPRGADVYGRMEEVKAAGHIAGKSDLKLALTGIVIDGRTLRSPPVITNSLPNRVARIQPIKWVAARLPEPSLAQLSAVEKARPLAPAWAREREPPSRS